MKKILTSIKKRADKLRFRFSAAEYMRVAYLSPRQVVLVTTRLGSKDNVLPIDWHIPLSFFPKLYCISLESKNFSSKVIDDSKCFAVNFMPAEYEEQILKSGRISGTDGDKFELTGLDKIDAEKINVPLIKDALGWLECKVTQKLITGDHTLFIGKVVNENLNRIKLKERLYHITSLEESK
ncbi:MAG TPA: flavin reductase family protein [Ignavibacteria bacterium]|jgi:flavin reductase (DIM6/NTAB) family NADH-FMN oxidoreductase RutF